MSLDRRRGWLVAMAYMTAPYLLIDVYVRGNQVESVGLALLPLTALGRPALRPAR